MGYEDIKAQAKGRWREILKALGVDVGDGTHGACIFCGGKDRARWINDGDREGYYCNACDQKFRDGWQVVIDMLGLSFAQVASKVSAVIGHVTGQPTERKTAYNPERMKKLYCASTAIAPGDPVHKYLITRGLDEMKTLPALRYCPSCYDPERKIEIPAMIGIFQAPDGEALTMTRTYIDLQGNKADISKPKKYMTPKKPMPGGAIRLFEFESGSLGIAEGIENAIACAIIRGIPVWAACDSGLLEAFRLPLNFNVQQLEIYGDNDTWKSHFAGQKAAYALGNRVSRDDKIPVEINIPPIPGKDWLDIYNMEKQL